MPGCGWWDSNPHGLAPRTLPTTGVYQFRHTRTIVSMLAPLACNDATPAASDTAGRGKLSWRSAQRRTEKRQDEAKKGGGGPRSAPNLLPAAAAFKVGGRQRHGRVDRRASWSSTRRSRREVYPAQ